MKTKSILTSLMSAAAGLALCASSAQAVNPTYSQGDLVLFFQKSGAANTFMVDLGASNTFRDRTTNLINITNIGSNLDAAFGTTGNGWKDLTTLFMGAAGVRSSSFNTSFQQNGDPNRTIYVSAARNPIGTVGSASSAAWGGISDSDMASASTSIIGMNAHLNNLSVTTKLTEASSTSGITTENPFLTSTQPSDAFNQVFAGGVETNFTVGAFGTLGNVSTEAALDIYRILATTNPAGTINTAGAAEGDGVFQGSVVIDGTGNVSFLVAPVAVPEPSMTAAILGLTGVAGTIRKRRRHVAA